MSFDYNKWEEELRPSVEAHEFAFEASAWEEMDKLLGQGGATVAPKDSIPPSTAGRFTIWIFRALIVLVVGLFCWWIFNTVPEKTMNLGGFSITATPEKHSSENQLNVKNALTNLKAESRATSDANKLLPASKPTKITHRPEPTESSNTLTATATPTESAPLLDRSAAYLTPLLNGGFTIPLLPSIIDASLTEIQIRKQKRKRNRRTLYPDVIEQY